MGQGHRGRASRRACGPGEGTQEQRGGDPRAGKATHILLPGCSYFADVDPEFVPVDICLLPDFSLRTPGMGGKVGASVQPLRGPPRQDRRCILLVTQVLALQHVLGVLPEKVPRHWRHVDHPREASREVIGKAGRGAPFCQRRPWSSLPPMRVSIGQAQAAVR